MYRTFLSWRYLLQRRTNLIGIVGIFVAVGALIMILSIMTGFLEESRNTLRGSLSDLLVEPYFGEGRGPLSTPRDPAPVLAAVRADPRVAAASAHMVWVCLLMRDGASDVTLSDSQFGQYAGVKLIGIDPEDEAGSTDFEEWLRAEARVGASVLDPSDPFAPPGGRDAGGFGRPRASVIVGEQLYKFHGLTRGAKINLATAIQNRETGELQPINREFVVAGTFRSSENEMDLERIYIERGQLARFLAGVDEDAPLPPNARLYSEILIKLKDYRGQGELVRDELEESLTAAHLLHPYSRIRTWEEYRGVLLAAIKNERALMAIMLSLVLLVAGFTIFAILSMMVTEKRRDIGILTALGATRDGVLMLFLMIGFWDALIGAVLGAVFGTWAAIEIDGIERWLSSTFGYEIFDRSVYLFDSIPSVVQPLWVALIVLGAFVCTLLFAAIPAWKASTMDPLDALRYE